MVKTEMATTMLLKRKFTNSFPFVGLNTSLNKEFFFSLVVVFCKILPYSTLCLVAVSIQTEIIASTTNRKPYSEV